MYMPCVEAPNVEIIQSIIRNSETQKKAEATMFIHV